MSSVNLMPVGLPKCSLLVSRDSALKTRAFVTRSLLSPLSSSTVQIFWHTRADSYWESNERLKCHDYKLRGLSHIPWQESVPPDAFVSSKTLFGSTISTGLMVTSGTAAPRPNMTGLSHTATPIRRPQQGHSMKMSPRPRRINNAHICNQVIPRILDTS